MSKLAINDGMIIVRCDYTEKEIVKEINAVWERLSKCWSIPFTTANIEYLIENLKGLQIAEDAIPKIREKEKREQKARSVKGWAEKDAAVRFRVDGVKLALYNYQKLGVQFAVLNDDGILLADEMGLGKSVQAIAVACYKKSIAGVEHCLVVVPASLKWNWPLEIEKFTDEKYVVIDGTPEERIEQWFGKWYCTIDPKTREPVYRRVKRTPVFFYVVNYELLTEDLFGGRNVTIKPNDKEETKLRKLKQIRKQKEREEILAPIARKVWPVVIIDEAQAIKNHGARRTRNVKSLTSQYRMALTGTPMDGRLEELHSIMAWVRPQLFENKTAFLQKHAEFDFWGRIKRYKNIKEVRDKIDLFFLRRLKKDVLKDLPDKIYENIPVILTDEELKIYKELADRGHEITEDAEAMVAVIRCKQFCNHPEMIDIETKKNSKLAAFLEALDEIVIQNGNKAIIFSQYAVMCEMLKAELDNLGLKYFYIWRETDKRERAAMQDKFNNDPSMDVMIGTDAMSEGLNFTSASYVINYDDAWSPSLMNQRSDRAHRLGQKDTVTVVNFICHDTVEERIRDVLYEKSAFTAEVLGDEIDEAVLRRLGPKDVAKLL